MSDLRILINSIEEKWLELLYTQVKTIFENDPMPSHSEDHHKRVWNYAVTIIEELDKNGIRVESTDLENLIISAFFHDTGLVIDRGPDHGKSSSLLCKKWLEENSLINKVDVVKIFHIIEYHDNKTYPDQSSLVPDGKINLPAILNISDDLDAFGHIGIYRYSEIYLIRKIPFEELGQQVLSNVSRRFKNFLDQCTLIPVLIKIHTPRYEVIEQFFKLYNYQLSKDPDGEFITSGPVFIVKIISRQLLNQDYSIENLCDIGHMKANNDFDREFFENLKKEWKKEI